MAKLKKIKEYSNSDYQTWGQSELIDEILKLHHRLKMTETITIDFTDGDIQEALGADYGELFDWTYPTEESGKDIRVILVKTE